jgi:peroxiredoxin
VLAYPRRSLLAALVALGVGLTACSGNGRSVKAASVKSPKDRKKAPDFTLKDSDGRTVRLSDYRGKVVLLNFWATWCGPCKIEIPWFIDFEQKYKDRGFAVLGIAMDDEGWDVVKPYIQERKVNYRVMMGSEEVATLYGNVESLPTTFLIDREGKIASIHVGLVGRRDYQDEILQLLDSTPPASQRASESAAARGRAD